MNYELKMILEKIKGDFICVYGEERKKFSSKEEFEKREMEGNCTVSSINVQDGVIVLELKKWESPMWTIVNKKDTKRERLRRNHLLKSQFFFVGSQVSI